MKSAIAIYARVSTDDQAERQTIEAQRHAIREWCRAHDHTVGEEFADDGVSGTIPFEERPAGRSLLQAARAGAFGGVVIYSPDRLARSVVEAGLAMREFRRLGLAVHFVVHEFADTPEGRMMFNQLTAFAEYEREVIRRRTVSGTKRAYRDGHKGRGRDPFGYRYNPETKLMDVVEVEADLIRDIASRYDAGESAHAIADALMDAGVQPPEAMRGHKGASHRWHWATIVRLLRHDYYSTGQWTFNFMGDTFTLEVPTILDADLQGRVIRKLAASHRFPRRRETRALFQGLIQCGSCERVYYRGASGWKDARRDTYHCAGRLSKRAKFDGTTRCVNPTLNMVETDVQLWSGFLAALADPKTLAERFLSTVESEAVTLRASIGGYGDLAELRGKRDLAIKQLSRPGVSLESVETTISNLDTQIDQLERRLEDKESEVRRFEMLAAKQATLQRAIASDDRVILKVEPRMADTYPDDSEHAGATFFRRLREDELRGWFTTGRKVYVTFAPGVEPPVDFRSVPVSERARDRATRSYLTTADRLLDWLSVKVTVSPDGTLLLVGTAIYFQTDSRSLSPSVPPAHTRTNRSLSRSAH